MRKVILYIAQSIDGYIATPTGSVDFLETADITLFEQEYATLLARIDTVIMGRTTFDQIPEFSPNEYPYPGLTAVVQTRRPLISAEAVQTTTDIVATVNALKAQPGQDLWLIGGASVITPLLDAGLVDELQITTVPVMLGTGIKMFAGQITEFNLQSAVVKADAVFATYTKKA